MEMLLKRQAAISHHFAAKPDVDRKTDTRSCFRAHGVVYIAIPSVKTLMPTIDWRGLGRAFLFFWYFSAVCHVLLLYSGATGFFPIRQGFIFSLAWLVPLLLFPQKARAIAAAIGVVLWISSLTNLGYFAIYRQEFSQSVLFIIFESNPAEASEYIEQYLAWWMFPSLLAYSLGAFGLWRCVRPLEMSPVGRRAAIAAIVVTLCLPPAIKIAQKRPLDGPHYAEAFLNRLEPAVPWQFLIGFSRYREQLANIQLLQAHRESIPPIGNLVDSRAGMPTTLVLVIGESTNRSHMSLYGYPRQTSPKLDAMREQLVVFNQAFASRPYTIEALQQILTFADQENPELYLTRPSLMNIMQQAGYRTYWITNQQTLTKRNTMLTSFSEQMDEQIYLNNGRSQNSYTFDGSVLQPFKKILDDGAERRFIVVHLLGTHMRYQYRYPPEYAVFDSKKDLPEWVSEAQLPLINEYDNAVRYNDHVVATLIDQLAAAGTDSLLSYFSDHGEDVYDSPNHDFIGRNEAKPTPPMYAVPFFLWTSPRWKANDPRRFDRQVDRPYQTSHFIHTWADLAGLRFDGFDPSKSIVNKRFKERPVLVGNPANPQLLQDLLKMPAGR